MQLANFDLWGILTGLFFFLTTCNSTAPVKVSSTDLFMPESTTEASTGNLNSSAQLTLILLGNGIYAFEGSDLKQGKFVNEENIRSTILAAKRQYNSAQFVVIIKPTTEATYKNTVDVLDEMAINKIERYRLEDLTSEEEKRFKTNRQNKSQQAGRK